MQLYFDVGVPKGNNLLAPEIALTAKLVSFSVQTGSPGGSLITANVQGIGKKTKITNIVYGEKDMCKTVTVKAYGKVECMTNVVEIPNGSEMKLKLADGTIVECGNSDP